MAVIGRGTFTPLIAPDLYRVFVDTGKERELEYTLFANVVEMPWNPVKDQQVSGLGTMPAKPEGVPFTLDQPILGGLRNYTASAYGMAVEVTFEMWRDELYGTMKDFIAGMKRASNNRQEVQFWALLNGAFTTAITGFTAGEALCATSHARLDGGTVNANRPSPDIGLSITGIQAAISRFENSVDERGLPRVLAPSMLLVAPGNKVTAREILGSSSKPFTSDNEINALQAEDLMTMVVHYFTNQAFWFLAASKGIHDLTFMWRDHPMFDAFDDPYTKNGVFTCYQRHAEGWSTWRGIDGSTG